MLMSMIDATSGTAMVIGSTNATSLAVGRTGVTTTINGSTFTFATASGTAIAVSGLNTTLGGSKLYGGTASGGQLSIEGTSHGTKSVTASILMPDAVASTSTTTGTLVITGGLGVSGTVNATTVTATTISSLIPVYFGFVVDMNAINTVYILRRLGSTAAYPEAFVCPCDMTIFRTTMYFAGTSGSEWTAGTGSVKTYVNNAQVVELDFSCVFGAMTSYTNRSGGTDVYKVSTATYDVSTGDYIQITVTTSADWAGNPECGADLWMKPR
jgi:hypothetical protein